jgi:hypothetical protein
MLSTWSIAAWIAAVSSVPETIVAVPAPLGVALSTVSPFAPNHWTLWIPLSPRLARAALASLRSERLFAAISAPAVPPEPASACVFEYHSAAAISATDLVPLVKLVFVPLIGSRAIAPPASSVPRPTSRSAGLSTPIAA